MPTETGSSTRYVAKDAAYYPLKLPKKLRKNLERLKAIRTSSSLNTMIVEILESEVERNMKSITKIRELQAK